MTVRICADPDEAVAGIEDGATVLVGDGCSARELVTRLAGASAGGAAPNR